MNNNAVDTAAECLNLLILTSFFSLQWGIIAAARLDLRAGESIVIPVP